MRIVQNLLQLIPYSVYLFVIAFFRPHEHQLFSIAGVEIFVAPLIVILLALNKPVFVSLWFGVIAGLVFDSYDPSHMGVHILLLAGLGLATSIFRAQFNLESIKNRVIFISIGLLFYSIPYLLIYKTSGITEFLTGFLTVSLPGVIYSGIIGGLFFMMQSGRFSYQKIRAMF